MAGLAVWASKEVRLLGTRNTEFALSVVQAKEKLVCII